jgi:hypothetical protein
VVFRNNCKLKEFAVGGCKESETVGQILLFLDSAVVYVIYVDSFKSSNNNSRTKIIS